MSNVPQELKYTRTHEWVRQMPDGLLEVGITDHAQEALGDMVSVQVPVRGRSVAAGEACAEVESAKAVSEVHSPVAGEIAMSNEKLASEPELINQEPYGKGWIMRVRPADSAWKTQLLSVSAYEQLLQAEPE
jgi:glycine cleavage system H protein